MLCRISEVIEYARGYTPIVLFSAEDSTRSDREFLVQTYMEAVRAGAKYINIPDTVGASTPWEFYDLVAQVRSCLPQDIWIDVHCHNDFGMATANTLVGIAAGADGAQVTVNRFGERAGNAALEEVVAALHFLMGAETSVKLEMLTKVSRLVAEKFGVQLQPNKPVVGVNAFAHEAGIHVHGVLENPSTYEAMPPEAVGNHRRIVLGRHSGRHAVALGTSGNGFRYGSSREHAVIALKAAGVSLVIAKSFHRIFYRNSINNGLLAVEAHLTGVNDGELVQVDLKRGIITVGTHDIFRIKPIPTQILEILQYGGLKERLRRLASENIDYT